MSPNIHDKLGGKTVWFNTFIQHFSLQYYKKTILIEGLSILKVYYRKGTFRQNLKLTSFIENGHLEKFRRADDRDTYINNYLLKESSKSCLLNEPLEPESNRLLST